MRPAPRTRWVSVIVIRLLKRSPTATSSNHRPAPCIDASRPPLRGVLAEFFFERRHHAYERAIDQRLGFDQPGAIVAEAIGELVGGKRHRLLALPVGEQVCPAQRA